MISFKRLSSLTKITWLCSAPPKNPWGQAAPVVAPACSLNDVMSEQLARQLEEEEGPFPSLAE